MIRLFAGPTLGQQLSPSRAGRDRLPACVVIILSVLDFIPLPPDFAVRQFTADDPQLLSATVFDFRLQLRHLLVQLRHC